MQIDKKDILTDNQLKEALKEAFSHYKQNHPSMNTEGIEQSIVAYFAKHFHINCNN